tara:strand:- start:49 stop:303 length:255 start_codon:yes stop_codon:yes gene_type:complete
MTNKEILKRKIIYRSEHRGTKEMDLLLGNFVKMHINQLNENELNELEKLLLLDDEILTNWYFEKKIDKTVPATTVSRMLKKFRL